MKTVERLLIILSFLVAIFLAYGWGYSFLKENVSKYLEKKVENILVDIGNKVYMCGYGEYYLINLDLNGETKIKRNYIEVNIPLEKTPLPNRWVVLYPRDINRSVVDLTLETNCTYVNCSWCLDYGCDNYPVYLGWYDNKTFAVFSINGDYRGICVTGDNISDGYLQVEECGFEGEAVSKYVVTYSSSSKVVVNMGNSYFVLGMSIPGTTILRLLFPAYNLKDGKSVNFGIICERGCWAVGKVYMNITCYEVVIGEDIRRFIKIELL